MIIVAGAVVARGGVLEVPVGVYLLLGVHIRLMCCGERCGGGCDKKCCIRVAEVTVTVMRHLYYDVLCCDES